MLFRKKSKKKNKKWLLLLLSHIYIPTGHHVNFTVLTLVELYRWQQNGQRPVLVKEWTYEGQTEARWKKANGKGTCIGRKPVGEEMGNGCFSISLVISGRSPCLNFVGFGEFLFHFVVKLWYFDVNRYGLVCLKVTECLFSGWWGGREKGKSKRREPSLRRAVA